MFQRLLVRNCQFLTTFRATGRQYATTIGRCHSLTETVLVLSLSAGRLICTFHSISVLPLLFKGCKDDHYLSNLQLIVSISADNQRIQPKKAVFTICSYAVRSFRTFWAWAVSSRGPHCDTTRDDASDASLPASA